MLINLKLIMSILQLISDAPIWLLKPRDFSGERGQNATLECRIDGNPSPTYTWFRDGDFHTVRYWIKF